MLIKFEFQMKLAIVTIACLCSRSQELLNGVFDEQELPRIRMASATGLSSLWSCSIIAISQYVMMATGICFRTAFSDSLQ